METKEKMLVINVGSVGMTKILYNGNATKEQVFFPPNIPVPCSLEMAAGLLKKYNNPNSTIHFKSAQDALLEGVPEKFVDSKEISEHINPDISDFKKPVVSIKKRGRPRSN